MAKQKKNNTFSNLLDLFDLADSAVEKFTGKNIPDWFKELQQQGDPQIEGERKYQTSINQSLNDPYLVLGLPPTASKDQVKNRYRQLARIFHPDGKEGYGPAMTKVNLAYEQILKQREKGGN